MNKNAQKWVKTGQTAIYTQYRNFGFNPHQVRMLNKNFHYIKQRTALFALIDLKSNPEIYETICDCYNNAVENDESIKFRSNANIAGDMLAYCDAVIEAIYKAYGEDELTVTEMHYLIYANLIFREISQ